jgi:hypothetical protein
MVVSGLLSYDGVPLIAFSDICRKKVLDQIALNRLDVFLAIVRIRKAHEKEVCLL